MVKFGSCAGIDDMPKLAEWGFDYVELPASAVMPEATDEEFATQRERIRSAGITPEAYNCFLPGDLKIVGPGLDSARIDNYVRTALMRMSELGGKVAVVGSSGSRNIPDGFSYDDALGQLKQFFRMAGDVAKSYGMYIAIEPLNSRESNIIHTTMEARDLARELAHTHVHVLADLYHMHAEQEPFTNLLVIGDYLEHVHIATPERKAPGIGDFDFAEIFSILKETGYTERISMEAGVNDYDTDMPRALAIMREEWEKAS
jgi:sugar phosphate isomerase/epimerase